jgi:hypothetical protein
VSLSPVSACPELCPDPGEGRQGRIPGRWGRALIGALRRAAWDLQPGMGTVHLGLGVGDGSVGLGLPNGVAQETSVVPSGAVRPPIRRSWSRCSRRPGGRDASWLPGTAPVQPRGARGDHGTPSRSALEPPRTDDRGPAACGHIGQFPRRLLVIARGARGHCPGFSLGYRLVTSPMSLDLASRSVSPVCSGLLRHASTSRAHRSRGRCTRPGSFTKSRRVSGMDA